MKPSFYFVLWILIYPILGLFNNSFINNNILVVAFAAVCGILWLLNKTMSKTISYERASRIAPILEDVYTGNVESFRKRFARVAMIDTITAIYFMVPVAVILKVNVNDWVALIVIGFITIGSIIRLVKLLKAKSKLHKNPTAEQCMEIAEDTNLLDYISYYEAHPGVNYESMLPERPSHYKVFQIVSIVLAVICAVLGLLCLIGSVAIVIFENTAEAYSVASMCFLGGQLATYFGIKDVAATWRISMKKTILGILGLCVIITVAIIVYAQNGTDRNDEPQLQKWEQNAERGDTAAMHRLIEFYAENAEYYIKRELTNREKQHYLQIGISDATDTIEVVTNEIYAERLNYWLDKGIANNDPVALEVKGMRLYYDNKSEAIQYLSKVADMGSARATLFCGAAAMWQGNGDEAFKYLTKAYELGAPGAGWYLGICYSLGIGTEPNRDKAIEVMRHAAIMDYPEAVSEMRRIEPQNKLWQHKADSLNVNFEDFSIIRDE